jgi:hypothetical protein
LYENGSDITHVSILKKQKLAADLSLLSVDVLYIEMGLLAWYGSTRMNWVLKSLPFAAPQGPFSR